MRRFLHFFGTKDHARRRDAGASGFDDEADERPSGSRRGQSFVDPHPVGQGRGEPPTLCFSRFRHRQEGWLESSILEGSYAITAIAHTHYVPVHVKLKSLK
jgi:hypothetical protein